MYFLFFLLLLPHVYRFCDHLTYIYLFFDIYIYIYIYIYMLMYVYSPISSCVVSFPSLCTCFLLIVCNLLFLFTLRCHDEFCLKCFRNTGCQSLSCHELSSCKVFQKFVLG